jgi:hypothetical protein
MVEVTKNDEDPSAFLTKSVSNRYPDIIKCDIGRSSGTRVRCLNLLGLDTWSTFDEHDGETIFGLGPYCKATIQASGNWKLRRMLQLTNLQIYH